ncbi:hypothetical protein HDV05_006267 [Chytridiales sp. JEL 0842]|nr:hypothetical protein HDV05_006267 [Chytridiales sp. JEL 0842]
MTAPSTAASKWVSHIAHLVPPLSTTTSSVSSATVTLRKGLSGRILVVGGSESYTGAPFFAGISTLRMGADICHIICEPSACGPIKAYSPELIVHPFLPSSTHKPVDALPKILSIVDRVHVVVLGPGLGRDPVTLQTVSTLLKDLKQRKMPVVIDADGLYMVQEEPSCVKGFTQAILTPNDGELIRLCKATGIAEPGGVESKETIVRELARALGGVTVLSKGEVDVISNGTETDEDVLRVTEASTPRRCGGQGDLLAGGVGAFLAWSDAYERGLWRVQGQEKIPKPHQSLLSSYAASTIIRRASKKAFEKMGRSMGPGDIIPFIGPCLEELYGASATGSKM